MNLLIDGFRSSVKMELIKIDNTLINDKFMLYSYKLDASIESPESIMNRVEMIYPVIGYVVTGGILHTFYPAPRMDTGLEIEDIFKVSCRNYYACYPYFEECITPNNILLTRENIWILPNSSTVFDGVKTTKQDFKNTVISECEDLFRRKVSRDEIKLFQRIMDDERQNKSI